MARLVINGQWLDRGIRGDGSFAKYHSRVSDIRDYYLILADDD